MWKIEGETREAKGRKKIIEHLVKEEKHRRMRLSKKERDNWEHFDLRRSNKHLEDKEMEKIWN
jgi:hypothetical protein